jgi:hypothetical protein
MGYPQAIRKRRGGMSAPAVQNGRSWAAGYDDGYNSRPYGTSQLATIDRLAYASGYTEGMAAQGRPSSIKNFPT